MSSPGGVSLLDVAGAQSLQDLGKEEDLLIRKGSSTVRVEALDENDTIDSSAVDFDRDLL